MQTGGFPVLVLVYLLVKGEGDWLVRISAGDAMLRNS